MKLDAILQGTRVKTLGTDTHEQVTGSLKPSLREAGALFQKHHKRKEWISGSKSLRKSGGRLQNLDTHPIKLTSRSGGSGLRGSYGLRFDFAKNEVYYGSDKAYARIHELGGKAGRGHSTYIPARPGLQRTIKATAEEIARIFGRGIDKQDSAG